MLIAQISDIHATADNGNLERLRRVINWLQRVQPDLLLVTGDLIDDGWCEGYRAIETELKRAKCRYLALPGNSDNREAMREYLPSAVSRAGETALHADIQFNNMAVIGVDTTLEGETRGDITPHLDWLALALERSAQPALIFMHHPLFPSGIAPLDQVMCSGAEAFANVIAHSDFRPLAVCCGHVHRGMSATIAGVPAYICGSVCPANPLMLDVQRIPPVTDLPALMIHDFREGFLVSSHIGV